MQLDKVTNKDVLQKKSKKNKNILRTVHDRRIDRQDRTHFKAVFTVTVGPT